MHDSRSKANALAEHFSSKFALPFTEANEFSAAFEDRSIDHWVLVRSRDVASTLANLDVDSGTGPDLLAARVLKYCGRELSRPIAKLIRRIIDQGFWPTAWTVHWLMALHKRNSASDPHNYRAMNLTAQVSKAV